MKGPLEAADDPIDLPAVLGLGDPSTLNNPAASKKVKIPTDPGLTPLMRAAKEGHVKAINLLLEFRAAVHVRDGDGMTPLHFAAAAGCRDSCEALLKAGANPCTLDESKSIPFDSLPKECLITR